MIRSRKFSIFISQIIMLVIFIGFFSFNTMRVFASTQTGIVTASTLNVRTGPGTTYQITAVLTSGFHVNINGSAKDSRGVTWYNISFTYGGTVKTGYASASYITVQNITLDAGYETYLNNQGFPESYKVKLRQLHVLHPNWVFTAKKVGLNWSGVLSAESVLGRNLVPGSSVSSWKSIDPLAYDSAANKWKYYDGTWVAASKEIIAYYIDPRNFLDDPSIFQFKSLSYSPGNETEAGVESILNGTFMDGSTYTFKDGSNVSKTMDYPSTFMIAAQETGVSPYNLAVRAKQEQGVSGSPLAKGTVPNYLGYFNFFNINAVDSPTASALVNGADYASTSFSYYYLPWTSPYKSILGGAKFLGSGYISKGQDSLYLQKFDVTDGGNGFYYHQYMTNVMAADSEATSLSKPFSGYLGNMKLVFSIPVYNNMPAAPAVKPVGDRIIPQTNNNTALGVNYRTHIQNVGWQGYAANGATSGTSGQSLRLEGININIAGMPNLGIKYKTHVQNIGWQGYAANGALSGTSGKSLRLEAIKIELTGTDASKYDVYYRVHAQNYGWLDWAKNGAAAGTEGLSKRLEAIQIKVLPKGTNIGESTSRPFVSAYGIGKISYRTHVQNIGWQSYVTDGKMSGTTGRSYRLEGINIRLGADMPSGSVVYSTHVQNYGWMNSAADGKLSGTTGEAKRLEAIKISLTGEISKQYDIYYHVHVQQFGWLGWAKNGAPAGSAGYSYRLEGIEIKLVPKGGTAPGVTTRPFMQK